MKNKIYSSICFSLLIILFSVNYCRASTILTDNFNSYDNGTISGQGGWVGSNFMTIQNEAVFEGSKSLKLSDPFSANFSVQKTGTLTNDGRMTIYVQGHLGGSTFPLIEVQLKEGDNTAISVKNHTGRDFSYYNGDIGSNSIFGPQMASDTWYALQIEWRSSDHTARYRINDGNFTNWKKGFSDWLSGLDTVNIGIFDGIGFVDAIQENFIPNKTPVLIVPGLVGTEIKKESQLLWPNIDRMSIDLNDSFLDDLQFNKN